MTNGKWGSEWPVAPIKGWPKNDPENTPLEEFSGVTPEMLGIKPVTWPKEATANSATLKAQGSNLVDDQAYLYFQCEGCNEILDPHTKSFAKLQEHRVNAGWKCVWNMNGQGYKVYCAKCGEKG